MDIVVLRDQNLIFSERGHEAYQIGGDDEKKISRG